MIKKLILISLLTVPCYAMAQSEWELPETAKAQTEKSSAQNTGTPKKEKRIEAKYAAGTVPVVDGKVVFETNISVPGASADALYDLAIAAVTEITKQPNQYELSRITAVNKNEHIVAACFEEEMVFSNSLLARDFTEFRYTLILKCSDGNVNVVMNRMSYDYEKGRKTHATYHADKFITDEEAINKKGNKLYRLNGKFRKRTIDRKDEIFTFVEQKVTGK